MKFGIESGIFCGKNRLRYGNLVFLVGKGYRKGISDGLRDMSQFLFEGEARFFGSVSVWKAGMC